MDDSALSSLTSPGSQLREQVSSEPTHPHTLPALLRTIRRLDSQRQSYRRNFAKLQSEYKSLQLHLAEQREKWGSELQNHLDALQTHQATFDARTAELAQLKSELFESEVLRKQVEDEVGDLRDRVGRAELARDEVERERALWESERERWGCEKERLESRVDEVREEEREKWRGGGSGEGIDSDGGAMDESTCREIEELRIQLRVLEEELRCAKEDTAELVASREAASAAHAKEYAKVIAKNRALSAQVERQKVSRSGLEERIKDHQGALERHHEKVMRLETKLSEAMSRVAEGDRKHAVELRQSGVDHKRATAELRADVERFRSQLLLRDREIEELRSERESWREQVQRRVEEEGERMSSELRAELSKRRDAEDRLLQLESELRDAKRRCELRVSEGEKEVSRVVKIGETQREEVERLRSEVADLESLLDKQRLTGRELRKGTVELHGSIEEQKGVVSMLRAEVLKLEEDRDEKTAGLEKAQLLVQYKERDRDEVLQQLEKMREDNKRIIDGSEREIEHLKLTQKANAQTIARLRRSREEVKQSAKRKIARLQVLVRKKDEELSRLGEQAREELEEARRDVLGAQKEASRWRRELDKARLLSVVVASESSDETGAAGAGLPLFSGDAAFGKQIHEMEELKAEMARLLRF